MSTLKHTTEFKNISFIILSFIIIASCPAFSNTAEAGEKCNAMNMYWAIGPDENTEYIELCSVGLGVKDVLDDFVITDISGTGVIEGNAIYWGGTGCTRVYTKNCSEEITGDCAWVAIQTKPIDCKEIGSYWIAPIAIIKYPSGKTANVSMGAGGYQYKDCECASTTLKKEPESVRKGVLSTGPSLD